MKLLCIDGNSIINRAFYGIKMLTTKNGQYTNAIYGFINILNKLLEKENPDCVAVEELFFTNNITTGIRVAEARGVILLAAENACVPIFEYTPPQVKQAVVGYGKAEKRQVISMVTMLLGLPKPPRPDDTADALAIAICHAHCGGSRLASYYNK